MKIDRDVCPPWPVIEQAHQVGVVQAKDRVWRYVGLFKGLMGETVCSSLACQKDPSSVRLGQEVFTVHRQPLALYVGQCRSCGFVYWGLRR